MKTAFPKTSIEQALSRAKNRIQGLSETILGAPDGCRYLDDAALRLKELLVVVQEFTVEDNFTDIHAFNALQEKARKAILDA